MLKVYPFGSGSFYTASYAVTASFAPSASLIAYVTTASNAAQILEPRSGSVGKGICLISYEDYLTMQSGKPNVLEVCDFSKGVE